MQRTHELEAAFIEIQHHGIDPVEAGAGHKPSEEGAHAALFGDGGVAGFRRGQFGEQRGRALEEILPLARRNGWAVHRL